MGVATRSGRESECMMSKRKRGKDSTDENPPTFENGVENLLAKMERDIERDSADIERIVNEALDNSDAEKIIADALGEETEGDLR